MPASKHSAGDDALSSRVSHGSARSLLLTLLGEYVYATSKPVWTATLIGALEGVDVAEKSARQAIARAAAAGWIDADRRGRRSRWRLAAPGRRLIAEGARRVRAVRQGPPAWNGRWIVLQLTLPQAQRAERLRLYRALSWIGFGNPTPGLWICPHTDRQREVQAVLDKFMLADAAYVFEAEVLPGGIAQQVMVARAWNVDAVSTHYAGLLTTFQSLRPRDARATLFAHIGLVNALQRLPQVDPGLPDELLPASWKGRSAASTLVTLRAKWADAAHAEWARLDAESAGP